MKILLIGISLLFATSGVYAQSLSSENAESPRRTIKPYASVEEALVSDSGASRYITPLTEWKRSEEDGNVTFSTTYVYPAAWLNRQLFVRVGSASQGYIVRVNGSEVGRTTNGTYPAEFNLTKKSAQGINELQIVIPSDNPNAELLLAKTPASLGEVTIVSQPTIRVRDIDTSTRLNDNGDGIAEFNIVVKTEALNPKTSRIHYELLSPDTTRLAYGYKDITLEMRGEDTLSFATIVPAKWLWSIHNPTQLRLVVRNQIEGRYAENIALPIGLREIANLKVQGYNTIMVKAGAAANELYSRCDSVGVYVIPQSAIDTSHGASHIRRDGGNPSNNPAWKETYLARAAEMYHTSKTHPSVVAFSLGGGDTNGINLYESYLYLKGLGQNRPIIFLGAPEEWNSDRIEGSVMPQRGK